MTDTPTDTIPDVNFDEDYVNLLDQVYSLTGQICTTEYAVRMGADKDKWEAFVNHPKFRSLCEERGIVRRTATKKIKNVTLTSTQLAAANAMLDLTDTRSAKKKLQDMGIPTQTYNKWLKDPIFQGYITARSNQILLENNHEIALALLDQIRGGNLKAIEYLHEWQGIFTRASNKQAASNNVDVVALIGNMIEIVGKHVKEPATLMAISNDLENLIRSRNAAQQLVAAYSNDETPVEVEEKPKRALPAGISL